MDKKERPPLTEEQKREINEHFDLRAKKWEQWREMDNSCIDAETRNAYVAQYGSQAHLAFMVTSAMTLIMNEYQRSLHLRLDHADWIPLAKDLARCQVARFRDDELRDCLEVALQGMAAVSERLNKAERHINAIFGGDVNTTLEKIMEGADLGPESGGKVDPAAKP